MKVERQPMKPYEKWPHWKGQEERGRVCHRSRLDSKFANDVMRCLYYTFHLTFMEIKLKNARQGYENLFII